MSRSPALDLGPGCDRLPLARLAEDVARCRERPISVRMTPLPAATGGGVAHVRVDRIWVLLDPDTGRSVESIWAHELAHVIDNLDGRVRGRNARTVARRERFADQLGHLLLEHSPTDVASARPLITAVRGGAGR